MSRVVFDVTESSTLRDETICKTGRCPAFIAELSFSGYVWRQFAKHAFWVFYNLVGKSFLASVLLGGLFQSYRWIPCLKPPTLMSVDFQNDEYLYNAFSHLFPEICLFWIGTVMSTVSDLPAWFIFPFYLRNYHLFIKWSTETLLITVTPGSVLLHFSICRMPSSTLSHLTLTTTLILLAIF